MAGWKANREGMLPDVGDPNWFRIVYQQTKHAAAGGQGPNRPPLLGRDACGPELDQGAVVADHTKGSIAGVGNLCGQIDDSLEDYGEGQLGRQSEPRLEQHVLAVTDLWHGPESTPPGLFEVGPSTLLKGRVGWNA